jgi:hypothetical protein
LAVADWLTAAAQALAAAIGVFCRARLRSARAGPAARTACNRSRKRSRRLRLDVLEHSGAPPTTSVSLAATHASGQLPERNPERGQLFGRGLRPDVEIHGSHRKGLIRDSFGLRRQGSIPGPDHVHLKEMTEIDDETTV